MIKNKETSETEKLAKGLNRGMKFAGWLVLFVIIGFIFTCAILVSI